MKILIESSSPLTNLGDEAILSANIQVLKDLLRGCEILVLSPKPEKTSKVHNVLSKANFMTLIGKWGRFQGRLKVIWLGLRLLWNAKRLRKRSTLKLLNDGEADFLKNFSSCDAFLIVGGGNLSDIAPWGGLFSRSVEILLAKIFGKPVFLGAQTVGPLRKKWAKMLVRFALEKADLITLRECYSYLLLRSIGIKNPILKVVPDDAFGINSISQQKAIYLLSKEDVDFRKLVKNKMIKVGLNVRPWWKKRGIKRIKNELLETIRFLIKDKRFYLIFFPTAYGEYQKGYNDVKGAKELSRYLSVSKDRVKILENEYTPQEIKGILNLLDIIITISYHPAVFAMSMAVPTIGLYEDEYYRMKLLGLFKMMRVEEFAIDITKTNSMEVCTKINKLLECRNETKEKLGIESKKIEKDVCFAAKQLINHLESRLSDEIRK